MMKTEIVSRLKIVGETFGARGCVSSCSCDPCDCDPCGCGSGHHAEPEYPRWRVSGYHIEKGEIRGLDVSGLTLLSLAQPAREGENTGWQEVLLVDERAEPQQIAALLAQFEERLESIPAEAGVYPQIRRAVYQVPFEYRNQDDNLSLYVRLVPDTAQLVRQGAEEARLREWSYDGPMALRGKIDMEH